MSKIYKALLYKVFSRVPALPLVVEIIIKCFKAAILINLKNLNGL